MNALLKKHFWAVNLAAIALLAWSAAASVNAVVATRLFVPPVSPDLSSSGDESGERAAMGRIPSNAEASQTLSERLIFSLTVSEAEDSEDGDGEEEDEGLENVEGELSESELPLDLLGTLVAEDPEHSMATLSVDGANKLSWVGTELLDGKATLVAISPRHVVVREGNELRLVKLWDGDGAGGRGKSAKRKTDRDKVASGSGSTRAKPTKSTSTASRAGGRKDFSQGVRKTAPYDYEIDRSMLDEQLQDLSALGSQARVVPNYRNGKYEGFKLVGVRPGSLYRAIGVRSGDVIKSVNGKPIDSPNKALDLFEQLKSSSHITLDIERRGQPKQLSYSIK